MHGQWVEGIVAHTPVYMEWYRKNTTLFLSVAQQLHDPRTTITQNVAGSGVEQKHFEIPNPQSIYSTPSPTHQTFHTLFTHTQNLSIHFLYQFFFLFFNVLYPLLSTQN